MSEENQNRSIKEWPVSERPREKLKSRGPESLSDAELLAVILRSGTRNRDAIALAQSLLVHHEGFRGLFKKPWDALAKEKGLGEAKIAALLSVIEIAKRHFRQELHQKEAIREPGDLYQYMTLALRDSPKEIFKVFYLNKANQIIRESNISVGTVDEAVVYPREVVKEALDAHATAVILAHNHPSGDVAPSPEDIAVTRAFVEAEIVKWREVVKLAGAKVD